MVWWHTMLVNWDLVFVLLAAEAPIIYIGWLYVGARKARREAEASAKATELLLDHERTSHNPQAFLADAWALYDSMNDRISVNCIIGVVGNATLPSELLLSTAERGAIPSVASLCKLDRLGARQILPGIEACTYAGIIVSDARRAVLHAVRDAMNVRKPHYPTGQLFAKTLVRIDESQFWSPVGMTRDPRGYEIFLRIDNWYALPEHWIPNDAPAFGVDPYAKEES